MKTLLFAITVCIGIISLSCSKEKDDVSLVKTGVVVNTSNQFPLEIGNLWKFNRSIIEVVGDTSFNGKKYYIVTTTPIIKNTELINWYIKVDSAYYRNDGLVTYVKYANDNSERKLFDFSISKGESFINEIQQIDSKDHEIVTLSNDSAIVLINNEKVTGKLFSYDIQECADEECGRVVSTEIGFISNYSYMWGLGDTLISYQLYNYLAAK